MKSKIVEIAKKEVGYKETPPNSNKTKYGKWFGLDGQPWCGMFCSWVYAKAGFKMPGIGFKNGFAGCQSAIAYFKKNGMITTTPEAGDLVFFDWNTDGRVDHVGIYVSEAGKGVFNTVEGNTSDKNLSNGGQVMERMRKHGPSVIFVKII